VKSHKPSEIAEDPRKLNQLKQVIQEESEEKLEQQLNQTASYDFGEHLEARA
jgi:hypothetical protein